MSQSEKKLTIGILADVDAGKTTLSEAMLYIAGALRKKGRVDNGDAFLDTYEMERERGITIFSKQAVFQYGGVSFTLIDTPGHADFTAKTERAAAVLDCAVMLINGADGVTAHALALWKILRAKNIPTFIFVNKTDLAGFDKERTAELLTRRLSDKILFLDGGESADEIAEQAATCDSLLLDMYLDKGTLGEKDIAEAAGSGLIFPCCFGSALRSEGVELLLGLLTKYTARPVFGKDLSARVYKIERDRDGKRMTVMKLTGGEISVRDVIKYRAADGSTVEEKVARIRLYNGGKATELQQAEAGDVVSLLGLSATYAGMGLGTGIIPDASANSRSGAAVCCAVIPPDGCDSFTLLSYLKELQEEDPSLCVKFNEHTQQTELTLSGQLQTDVLLRQMRERFGIDVTFGAMRVLYKETVTNSVEGVGHFEPLRHYAEVHLLLSPLPSGSGLVFDSALSEDKLDRNWQNLIISSLKSKEHIGVLTGSPITDMRITLVAGRAHPKHTEGGDFRQAAWRALRQGLMKAQSRLLEPYFSFTLEVPPEHIGRALTDLDSMHAEFSQPEPSGELSQIKGRAPAAALKSYAAEVAGFTNGRGGIYTEPDGYSPCEKFEEVISQIAYDPTADLDNTPDSVFCSHGAGTVVPWDEVEEHMHLPALSEDVDPRAVLPIERSRRYSVSEDELRGIMQKISPERVKKTDDGNRLARETAKRAQAVTKPDTRPRLLLVDGYNIIFAWEELRELARSNIDAMLIFDAYKTPAVTPHRIKADPIEVIYTRSGQTSDAFIESFCSENKKKFRVKVASSDGAVQMSVMRCGALRMSARELEAEITAAERCISEIISEKL